MIFTVLCPPAVGELPHGSANNWTVFPGLVQTLYMLSIWLVLHFKTRSSKKWDQGYQVLPVTYVTGVRLHGFIHLLELPWKDLSAYWLNNSQYKRCNQCQPCLLIRLLGLICIPPGAARFLLFFKLWGLHEKENTMLCIHCAHGRYNFINMLTSLSIPVHIKIYHKFQLDCEPTSPLTSTNRNEDTVTRLYNT